MAFTGRLGQVESVLANIRLGYGALAGPPPIELSGTSSGVATVSGTLTITYGRQITLSQEVVESDVLQTDRERKLFQLVVEVDGYDWVLPTVRILSAQFV